MIIFMYVFFHDLVEYILATEFIILWISETSIALILLKLQKWCFSY